eukprot:3116231-Rhodomonas_salina.1
MTAGLLHDLIADGCTGRGSRASEEQGVRAGRHRSAAHPAQRPRVIKGERGIDRMEKKAGG